MVSVYFCRATGLFGEPFLLILGGEADWLRNRSAHDTMCRLCWWMSTLCTCVCVRVYQNIQSSWWGRGSGCHNVTRGHTHCGRSSFPCRDTSHMETQSSGRQTDRQQPVNVSWMLCWTSEPVRGKFGWCIIKNCSLPKCCNIDVLTKCILTLLTLLKF